jgi:secondary thiamine-phosphate synthase enzyme
MRKLNTAISPRLHLKLAFEIELTYKMLSLQSFSIEVETTAGTDILDLTPQVAEKVRGAGVSAGLLTLFIAGSTAALTTIEYESGAVHDLKSAIERLFPRDLPYEHDRRWGDGNGYAHVRAAFLKPSLSIPIDRGGLLLGTWQQIVLLDFDNRPRQRRIHGQVLGFQPANG